MKCNLEHPVNIFDISKNTDMKVKYSWDTWGFKFQLDPALAFIGPQGKEASDGGTLRRLRQEHHELEDKQGHTIRSCFQEGGGGQEPQPEAGAASKIMRLVM